MTRVHPRHDLDHLLLHPVRLSILATLAGVERAEFALVRDSVEVSDSMLSKQVAQLERAGYVKVAKGRVARHSRTWLRVTARGMAVYDRHIQALQTIAALDFPRSADHPAGLVR